ncbi:MAG: hypothetical protein HC897_11785 [Thermoanaerobaculia bacterium]|nr:hypothetical protein [Thermoanaerobaculia bacterium]
MYPQLTTDVDKLFVDLVHAEIEMEPTGGLGRPRRNAMTRVIKRYESRKLYDTEESRYVSLEDVARWVRDGQEVKVIDNATADDVTHQVLTQIILDEGKRGVAFLPKELLHELVRAGEKAVSSGVEQVQHGVDRLMRASLDRLSPVREAREEMAVLRARLGDLERTLASLETEITSERPAKPPAPRKPAKPAVRKRPFVETRAALRPTHTRRPRGVSRRVDHDQRQIPQDPQRRNHRRSPQGRPHPRLGRARSLARRARRGRDRRGGEPQGVQDPGRAR